MCVEDPFSQIRSQMFIAIECWDKSYEFRKIEKVGKNHVPTCSVFAGPVTNYSLYNCECDCLLQ